MPVMTDPFGGPAPAEVPLLRAPLVRVLCQIKFPEILAVEKKEFVSPYQEHIRKSYPVLRQEQGASFVLGPQGAVPGKTETTWRFADASEEAWVWRVSLAPTFVTLETKKYTSRDDFLERLRLVVEALASHVSPSVVDRIGVRYVDRVEGEPLTKLNKLVRPEVLGLRGAEIHKSMDYLIQEAGFTVTGGSVLIRSGSTPPNTTVDPMVIDAVPHACWLLDLDIFEQQPVPFNVAEVLKRVGAFAERGYAVFRWAVTDEFLREYGGNV